MQNIRSFESTKIGVCGAGSMGAGIAQVAAQAGHNVVVLDRDEEPLQRGQAVVENSVSALLKRRKVDESEALAIKDRISWTLNINDLATASLVIEAIVENPDAKQELFKSLEAVLEPTAIIATNTSSLAVTRLASGLHYPKRFLGLHFFNPAPVMKLVEVVCGLETDEAISQAAVRLMQGWGKQAVTARDVPGFIVNRVARPFYGEGWRALEEGAADSASIDFLYRDLAGFRMGPLELGDLIGHDINSAAAQSVFDAYSGKVRFTPSLFQKQLVAAGRLGRKSGRGVYEYGGEKSVALPQFLEQSPNNSGVLRVSSCAKSFKDMLKQADVEHQTFDSDGDEIEIDGVIAAFTDGRTARRRSALAKKSFILLDWMSDPAAASTLAFSVSDSGSRKAAVKLAHILGKKALEIADRPGLIVFRTLAQLANCAADAVRDRVGDADSIDRALRYGVNYPIGPLSWAREFGAGRLVSSLDAIADATGDPIYRPSEVLRALAEEQG